MRKIIAQIPLVGSMARYVYREWIAPPRPFLGSESYWRHRYDSGGNSGDGSRGKLAEFKAQTINAFVGEQNVESVLEFGCGDGNQLKLSRYPTYIGFDISPKAVSICREAFAGDATKEFRVLADYEGESAELTLSLDVVYHLVEDHLFSMHMHRLFDSSSRFVIIYSSDTDEESEDQPAHVRHRRFTRWVIESKPEWMLRERIRNRYPFEGNTKTGSFADFFIYERARSGHERQADR